MPRLPVLFGRASINVANEATIATIRGWRSAEPYSNNIPFSRFVLTKNTAPSVYVMLFSMRVRKPRKQQERAAVTRDLLLRAAEQVFARVGYEKAQVEEIAEAAGFSKGALYAHFKSKEELFLALYKAKTISYQAKLRQALDSAPTREKKIAAFRSFYIDLSKEKYWALLVLEVKLFITRYPEVKQRLRQIDEHVGDSIEGALTGLFGNSARSAGEALGGIFSALVLEADLEPDVLPERKMRAMLGTIFDALLGLRDQATQTKKARE
jgi:AcrR family transcriptional regulator